MFFVTEQGMDINVIKCISFYTDFIYLVYKI